MWFAVGALSVVGAVQLVLESLIKAGVTWSLPILWLVPQLAASVTLGVLLGVHAAPRRRLVAVVAALVGVALVFVFASIEDPHWKLTARYLPGVALAPLASLAAAEAVHRLAPAARSGPASTCVLAATSLLGLVIVCALPGDELLHLPIGVIVVLVLAAAFATGSVVQSLIATRQVAACGAAPLLLLLRVLGGRGTVFLFAGALVLALLMLWGAHRAWRRKLARGTATEVTVPAARAT